MRSEQEGIKFLRDFAALNGHHVIAQRCENCYLPMIDKELYIYIQWAITVPCGEFHGRTVQIEETNNELVRHMTSNYNGEWR